MGNAALNLGVNFDVTTCGECGGVYALAARYVEQCRAKGRSWTCPYCKIGWGFRESAHTKERKRLEAQLKREKERRRWAEESRKAAQKRAEKEAHRAAGYKGALTKTKKRVGRGVCPCCNRSFTDLRRHMETKHPHYVPEPEEPEREDGATSGLCGEETASGESCTRRTIGGGPCWQHPVNTA